jgi:transcriptional regulator with XRE-family HTH domain
MNRPDYTAVLNALCRQREDLLRADGSVNHNEVARKLKMNQPTVTRHLRGEVVSPRGKSAEKFCRYFDVSYDQLVGRAVVEGLFPDDAYDYPMEVREAPRPYRSVAESLELAPEEEFFNMADELSLKLKPRQLVELATLLLNRAKDQL